MSGRQAGVLLLAVLLAGCASAPPGAGGGAVGEAGAAATPASASQLLVLMDPAPARIWQGYSAEIAGEYRLEQLAAWTVGSLDNTPCVIYQALPGRDIRQLVHRLAADPRVSVAQPVQRFRLLGEEQPKGAYN
ncbi:MAG TPA: hypothetical protein VGV61_01905, partial [Thermoanaerobaculia bacterium]|nr:hypothetical protein [Thermoanaerobaculia bacterium]